MTKYKSRRKLSQARSFPNEVDSASMTNENSSGKKRSREELATEESESEQLEQQAWSKSKKKRMRVRSMKERQQTQVSTDIGSNDTKKAKTESVIVSMVQKPLNEVAPLGEQESFEGKGNSNTTSSQAGSTKLSALQIAFQERLTGSRFRILNEELYTSTSTTAFQRFQRNPSLFDEYHEGFRHQVGQWPINPVTIIGEQLTQLYLTRRKAEPSNKKMKKKIVVADFGCGEAELAKQLLMIRDNNNNNNNSSSTGSSNACPFIVHSFDLVAKGPNAELITACDAAHTPLAAGSVDYGIFCLALMGTNLADFIREGHRVLKPDGRLFIAEVRSRFESTTSSEMDVKQDKSNTEAMKSSDSSLQQFIQVLDQLGFETYHTDRTNTMFVLLNLKKNGKKPRRDLKYTAKPCIYKRR